MVAYHSLTHQEIFGSFVTGKPLELHQPDSVDGPGCIDCGRHWMDARYEPCVPREFPEEET
jgi:hypothetical protein